MCLLFRRKKENFSKKMTSPNSQVIAHFYLKNGQPSYDLFFNNQETISESALGLQITDTTALSGRYVLVRSRDQDHDETWQTIVGEQAEIRNHYNEYAFYLTEKPLKKQSTGRLLTIRFRIFDDSFAFRYEVPPQPQLIALSVSRELTQFNINYNASSWSIPAFQPDRYEYDYHKHYIYELEQPRHTPLTIKDLNHNFLCIHEAALYNYGEMTLRFDGQRALETVITPRADGDLAHVELPWNTPWRVVMLATTELGLITNRSLLNLNDPPRSDFHWVQPLKFLGIWWAMYVGEWTWAPGERHGATTQHAKEYIDACSRLGIKGLLIEGWNNGWDGDWLQNGAANNFTSPESDFDLDYISAYAHVHGVDLIGHHETVGFVDNYEAQLDRAYRYYAEHGIRYVKSGYAGSMMTINGMREWHHSQSGIRHYQKALELAAKYHICLDVHEGVKGTGIERTWPNLLTRECARGQEYEGGALAPSHACYLPFTRLLAGGMDYTSGILDVTNQNKRIASTITRQLAYYITIFSGMQMAADRPPFYEKSHPALATFISNVPVNWRQTIPLLGAIGEYYVVARQARDNDDWYIGGITDGNPRRVRLPLTFLEPGRRYRAYIYRDGEDAHYRDNQLSYIVEERILTNADSLDIYLAPGGGFAIRCEAL